jgi:hypothetical protein
MTKTIPQIHFPQKPTRIWDKKGFYPCLSQILAGVMPIAKITLNHSLNQDGQD